MALRCRVFRGFVREAEEEINEFLSTHVLQVAQSRSGDQLGVTRFFENLDPPSDRGL